MLGKCSPFKSGNEYNENDIYQSLHTNSIKHPAIYKSSI